MYSKMTLCFSQVLHGDAVLDELLVSLQIESCPHSCLDAHRRPGKWHSFCSLVVLRLMLGSNDQDCTILSGDVIIRHLAQLLSPKYVVFLVLLPSLLCHDLTIYTICDRWFSTTTFFVWLQYTNFLTWMYCLSSKWLKSVLLLSDGLYFNFYASYFTCFVHFLLL